MDKIVELIHGERWGEGCKLNLTTGEKNFCNRSELSKGFLGAFFDGNVFLPYIQQNMVP